MPIRDPIPFLPDSQTDIYEVAMTIVESLTEDTAFSEWLTETWIPYIQQQ